MNRTEQKPLKRTKSRLIRKTHEKRRFLQEISRIKEDQVRKVVEDNN